MPEVNQQLIAERLQISVATVSRCFTNHPGINPLTRARVFQLAAELGYTHQEMRTGRASKKATATSKPKVTFGVLICSEEEEYYRKDYQNPSEQILAGITECAHVNGVKVEVHLVDPKAVALDDPTYLKIEKFRRRWNGLLLVYPFPSAVLDALAIKMPLVSLVEQYDHAGLTVWMWTMTRGSRRPSSTSASMAIAALVSSPAATPWRPVGPSDAMRPLLRKWRGCA